MSLSCNISCGINFSAKPDIANFNVGSLAYIKVTTCKVTNINMVTRKGNTRFMNTTHPTGAIFKFTN